MRERGASVSLPAEKHVLCHFAHGPEELVFVWRVLKQSIEGLAQLYVLRLEGGREWGRGRG